MPSPTAASRARAPRRSPITCRALAARTRASTRACLGSGVSTAKSPLRVTGGQLSLGRATMSGRPATRRSRPGGPPYVGQQPHGDIRLSSEGGHSRGGQALGAGQPGVTASGRTERVIQTLAGLIQFAALEVRPCGRELGVADADLVAVGGTDVVKTSAARRPPPSGHPARPRAKPAARTLGDGDAFRRGSGVPGPSARPRTRPEPGRPSHQERALMGGDAWRRVPARPAARPRTARPRGAGTRGPSSDRHRHRSARGRWPSG